MRRPLTEDRRKARAAIWGRSVVLGQGGMVATSQPLATQAGVDILRRGGTAMDAAVAAAATLAVVEPMSTGIGGDLFALYYSASERRLKGYNGSGWAPARLGVGYARERGWAAMPTFGPHSVTVPGAPEAWQTLLGAEGRLGLETVLQPAIAYARDGFPVSEVIARNWLACAPRVAKEPEAARVLLPGGQPPKAGDIMRFPELAATLSTVAEQGARAFYEGPLAESLLAGLRDAGSLMTADDFASYQGLWQEPVSTDFAGHRVWELPPNGQGAAALIALNIVERMDLTRWSRWDPRVTHVLAEAVGMALAERDVWFGDPASPAPLDRLLSPAYAEEAAEHISLERARVHQGTFLRRGETVYLCAADKDGNMVSLIASLFRGFGSGIMAPGTGVVFQNRGALFSLEDGHPNALGGHRRPLHTIIPGIVTTQNETGAPVEPVLAFGIMGGHHQVQAHVQFLTNLFLFGQGLQESLDAPRFDLPWGEESHGRDPVIGLERGVPPSLPGGLEALGYRCLLEIEPPGGGQSIWRDPQSGVLHGASDARKDGQAAGF